MSLTEWIEVLAVCLVGAVLLPYQLYTVVRDELRRRREYIRLSAQADESSSYWAVALDRSQMMLDSQKLQSR